MAVNVTEKPTDFVAVLPDDNGRNPCFQKLKIRINPYKNLYIIYEGCPKSKFPYFIKNQWRDQASQDVREI